MRKHEQSANGIGQSSPSKFNIQTPPPKAAISIDAITGKIKHSWLTFSTSTGSTGLYPSLDCWIRATPILLLPNDGPNETRRQKSSRLLRQLQLRKIPKRTKWFKQTRIISLLNATSLLLSKHHTPLRFQSTRIHCTKHKRRKSVLAHRQESTTWLQQPKQRRTPM